ncbi:MAG: hypothetical protein FWD48_11505, partial [Oscillospiraceae bacterium]|nr:hypothetical protein [Oscillospiraceae bacterium]
NMRVIEIPKFRAVSSGLKTHDELFGENGFEKWKNDNHHLIKQMIYEQPDFWWEEEDKNIWIWAIKDDVTKEDTAPYEIIEFEGGIFLVATQDENDNNDETVSCMFKWIESSEVFEYNGKGICNMPSGNSAIDKALGVSQQQVFLQLKYRAK